MDNFVIVVGGHRVDVAEVYDRMYDEARVAGDGRRIHDCGLKYLLSKIYGLHADSGTPGQPLLDMRREVAAALLELRWIAPMGRNNGRYELLRSPGRPTAG
jgi:hypothetical protein